MAQISQTRKPTVSGLSVDMLRLIGGLLLAASVTGRAIIENGLLHLSGYSNAELLAAMENSPGIMQLATVAVILQTVGLCAIPVYAFLLAEGVQHTQNLKAYVARVGALALVCEIPYNLAYSGKWLDTASRNPVFGLLLALLMLCLLRQFSGQGVKTVLVSAAVIAAAAVWVEILHVQDGIFIVGLAAAFWLLRGHPLWRLLAGCAISAFMVTAPLAVLLLHFYNGEKGRADRRVCYAIYPVLLLAGGLAGTYLL